MARVLNQLFRVILAARFRAKMRHTNFGCDLSNFNFNIVVCYSAVSVVEMVIVLWKWLLFYVISKRSDSYKTFELTVDY